VRCRRAAGRGIGCLGAQHGRGKAAGKGRGSRLLDGTGFAVLGVRGGDVSGFKKSEPRPFLHAHPTGLSPAEAVVRLNSLYTTWQELCAEHVGGRQEEGLCGGI
jgi:hypothetical protein